MSTASIETSPSSQIWRGAGQNEHFVQFYEDDSTLLASLQGYLEHHLHRGAAAIVIATGAHLDALVQQCLTHGLDLDAAQRAGQYLPLNADHTLEQVCGGGAAPEIRSFTALIEPLLLRAAEQFPRIVSFDEMVALLWNQGRHAHAVRLEELWNGLASHYAFGQYCAYPMPRSQHAWAPDPDALGVNVVLEPPPSSEPAPAAVARSAPARSERLAKAAQLQHEVRMLEAAARELTPSTVAHVGDTSETSSVSAATAVDPVITDFFEYAPLPLHSVSAEGRIEWANEAELALLGYQRDEYIGHRLSEFHREAHSAAQMLSRLLSGQALREQPVRVLCKDRSVRSFLLDCQPEWDAGRFVRTRCCLRELGANDGVVEPAQLAGRVLDQCDQPLLSTSLTGHIQLWNAAAERLLGYSADERRGTTSDDLFTDDSRDRLQCALAMLEDTGHVAPIKIGLLTRAARRMEAMATLSAVRDSSGALMGVSYLLRELDDGAEREASELRAQMDRRDRYLSGLAHDLRNPLMPLANTAVLLRRLQGDPAAVTSLCDLLDRQVSALRKLTEDALNTSRSSHAATASPRRIAEPA